MTRLADRSVTFTAFLGRPVQDVAKVLVSEASEVIGGHRQHDADRVVVDLDVPLGKEGAVSRAAAVAIGLRDWEDGQLHLSLTVNALERERWFPTFHGSLEADEVGIGETRLQLIGSYELPLGVFGRATGRAGSDKLARASLYSLFVRIVTTLENELRESAPGWRPSAASGIVRDHDDHPLG